MYKVILKRVLSLLLVVIFACAIISCGNEDTETGASKRKKEKTEKVTEEDDEEEGLDEEPTEKPTKRPTKEPTKEPEKPKFEAFSSNELIATEFVEISLDDMPQKSFDLLPLDTSKTYSYYKGEEGQQFFFIRGNFKNIGGETVQIDAASVEFCFDNKYKYTANIYAYEGNSISNYAGVSPLKSVKFCIAASVPDELLDVYKECRVRIVFNDGYVDSYERDMEKYDYRYEIIYKR